MKNALLCLNVGSSSLKWQLFEDRPDLPVLYKGNIAISDHRYENGLRQILSTVAEIYDVNIKAVGHRVVHGGSQFKGPVLLTEKIIRELKTFIPLAPMHQPHSLSCIHLISTLMPEVPQIACFDTSFHLKQDDLFTRFALPKDLREKGIRRYGFHGLSYEWVTQQMSELHPQLALQRIIVAHLGSGASVCAIKNGKSVATSMGMTALDGLPMGTRCGAIDPGVILYMIQTLNIAPEEVERILYQESGLKGLSRLSGDIQELLSSNKAEARNALDYFIMKTAQHIAMLAVTLGGLDVLVFTGGIGEHVEQIRAAITAKLYFLLPFERLIIPANEERVIAQHMLTCLKGVHS